MRIARIISAVIVLLAALWVGIFILIDNGTVEIQDPKIREVLLFPGTVVEVAESNEIRRIPPTFGPDQHFEPINKLKEDIYALNSFYIDTLKTWEVHLFNFRTDSILHKWTMNAKSFFKTDRLYPNVEPRNPILLADRNIIAAHDESYNLYRLDAESNVVWHNTEMRFHHGYNLGPDGNIWICTGEGRAITIRLEEDQRLAYDDEFLTKVDVETGKILFNKSVSDILIENGYRGLIYGCANKVNNNLQNDPLHLNDIEPVFEDGPYWKKGDLFLSLRHRSVVLLYRPSTNKIIKLILGDFFRQHDVDIVNDSTISMFHNEGTNVGEVLKEDHPLYNAVPKDTLYNSNLVHYHFGDGSATYPLKHHFDSEKLFTNTQGFQQLTSTGLTYVEDHGAGIMYFMNENEIVYKSQTYNAIDDWIERPHWVRIYENVDF
jgi:hypothetical protein